MFCANIAWTHLRESKSGLHIRFPKNLDLEVYLLTLESFSFSHRASCGHLFKAVLCFIVQLSLSLCPCVTTTAPNRKLTKDCSCLIFFFFVFDKRGDGRCGILKLLPPPLLFVSRGRPPFCRGRSPLRSPSLPLLPPSVPSEDSATWWQSGGGFPGFCFFFGSASVRSHFTLRTIASGAATQVFASIQAVIQTRGWMSGSLFGINSRMRGLSRKVSRANPGECVAERQMVRQQKSKVWWTKKDCEEDPRN
jgi:hypothetical protein